jgi:hypothetical protein
MALKTALKKVGKTLTTIVQNPPESGVCIKISTLLVCNVLTDAEASVEIKVTRDGSDFSILKDSVLGAGKNISVFAAKDIGIYLEEGDALKVGGSLDGALDVVCTYSEIDPLESHEE